MLTYTGHSRVQHDKCSKLYHHVWVHSSLTHSKTRWNLSFCCMSFVPAGLNTTNYLFHSPMILLSACHCRWQCFDKNKLRPDHTIDPNIESAWSNYSLLQSQLCIKTESCSLVIALVEIYGNTTHFRIKKLLIWHETQIVTNSLNQMHNTMSLCVQRH